MLTEVKTPYELLVRWGADGKLAGAHVGFITRILKDGVEISQDVGSVLPVSIGTAPGFPLADILGQLHIDALVAYEYAKCSHDDALSIIAALKAEFNAYKTAQLTAD